MDKVQAQDSALHLSQLLELMWCVHAKYEGLNKHDMVLYRLGIQTFLLEAIEETKTLLKAVDETAEQDEE